MYERTSNSGNEYGLGREHARVFAYGDELEIPGVMERNGAKNINCVNNNMIVHVVQMV